MMWLAFGGGVLVGMFVVCVIAVVLSRQAVAELTKNDPPETN